MLACASADVVPRRLAGTPFKLVNVLPVAPFPGYTSSRLLLLFSVDLDGVKIV